MSFTDTMTSGFKNVWNSQYVSSHTNAGIPIYSFPISVPTPGNNNQNQKHYEPNPNVMQHNLFSTTTYNGDNFQYNNSHGTYIHPNNLHSSGDDDVHHHISTVKSLEFSWGSDLRYHAMHNSKPSSHSKTSYKDDSKLDDLIHVIDLQGVVDYLYKSCSGKPYGGMENPGSKKKKPQRKSAPISKPKKKPSQIPKRKIWSEFNPTTENYPFPQPIFPKHDVEPQLRSTPNLQFEVPSHVNTKSPTPSDSSECDSSDSSKSGMVCIPVQELISDNGLNSVSRCGMTLCKNYLSDGSCSNKKCKFLHSKPLTAHRDQIIFLGGLPKDIGRADLYKELIKNNIPVINFPMVIDKFTPRVVLKTREAARFYIKMKTLNLFGKSIDVREYKQSNEVFQVFLGGLPMKTTVKDIEQGLNAHNCSLMNVPTINKGYSINVEIASKEEQKLLVGLGHIKVLGKHVEVKTINKRKKKSQNRKRS